LAATAKLVAEPGRKLESSGATADDHDAMRAGFIIGPAGVAVSRCISHRSLLPRWGAVGGALVLATPLSLEAVA
jgi:hypothetical protein